MKIQMKWLYGLLLLMACNNTSPNTAAAKIDPLAAAKVNPINSNTLPPRKDACEIFSASEIEKFFGWETGTATVTELLRMKDRPGKTNCLFFRQDGTQIAIRLSWQKEKQIEFKGLSKMYEKYLSEGEVNLKYQSRTFSKGTETLFGEGAARTPNFHQYIWRTRYDDIVEVIIETHTQMTSEQVQELNEKVMAKL